MISKTLLAKVSGLSALALVATCGSALAFGHHGHHGDMQFGLLAHAAGITHDQIRTAFTNDATLKTDFQNLKTSKTAMDACIVAGTCTNEVATYASAQQTLTLEKLAVWQKLFASAPNKAQAVSLKGQLDQLNAQKHQIMHQAFSSAQGSSSMTTQQAE
jgi:hypothetical protein